MAHVGNPRWLRRWEGSRRWRPTPPGSPDRPGPRGQTRASQRGSFPRPAPGLGERVSYATQPGPWALPSLLGTQDCLKLLPTPKLGLALGSWLREWEGPAAPTPRPGKEDVGDRGEGGRGSLKRIWQERGWGRM